MSPSNMYIKHSVAEYFLHDASNATKAALPQQDFPQAFADYHTDGTYKSPKAAARPPPDNKSTHSSPRASMALQPRHVRIDTPPIMPNRIPDMSSETKRLIVVAHVHCQMSSEQISLALGLKPNSTSRYYTAAEVRDAYQSLKNSRTNTIYPIWGPKWKDWPGTDFIIQSDLDGKKALVWEGLRRAKYMQKLLSMKAEERATRRREWTKINEVKGRGWRVEDEQDLKWDALVERRR